MHRAGFVVCLIGGGCLAGLGCSTGVSSTLDSGAIAAGGGAAAASGSGAAGEASSAAGGANGAPFGGSAAIGGAGSASSGGSSGIAGSSGSGGQGERDGGSDAGANTATDRCDHALFCETFESYAPGGPPSGDWQPLTNHGEVTIVEEHAFGGSRSARLVTEAQSGAKTAFIRLGAAVFPVPGNAYFGRMMFRLESAPETGVHWTFIQATGTVPGETHRAQYRYGGQHPVSEAGRFIGNQLMANYETPDSYSGVGPSSDCWLHADEKVVPVGRWACAEWQFDGPSNTMRLWLDGEPIEDLTMTGQGQGCVHQPATFAWTAPTFATLELGWESFQSDAARTLYIDDVVIDTEQVGCPSAAGQ